MQGFVKGNHLYRKESLINVIHLMDRGDKDPTGKLRRLAGDATVTSRIMEMRVRLPLSPPSTSVILFMRELFPQGNHLHAPVL